ncbi:MAG TPA: LuxR C-terminal-related transcriptional regulator [Kofleriaceae bacterium]|nr:LuxR C-terminal-related transcriptional regulator [Kofleriaceae bacterium]
MTRNPLITAAAVTSQPRTHVSVIADDAALLAALSRVAPAIAWNMVKPDTAIVGDVVMLDSHAARPLDVSHIAQLRARKLNVIVLVESSADAKAAVAAGARGVLMRAQCADGAAAAIAAVRNGLQVVDIGLADAWAPAPATPTRGNLTEREYQVVQLLAEGLSNKLIADRLGISDHTAKFHVNGVMVKLGASTRTEAVVAAMRQGVVKV